MLSPSFVFEQTVDGVDAGGRVEPLGVEVTVFEFYVPEVRQRPLRVLGLAGGVCTETGERFDPFPECPYGQTRIVVGPYNGPTYRLVCDAASPIANDHVELVPVSHRSAHLMDDPSHARRMHADFRSEALGSDNVANEPRAAAT